MNEVVDVKKRQMIEGVVTSVKMNKTRVCTVARRQRHSQYLKRVMKKTRIFFHDEKNTTELGDYVLIMSSRPISKMKHFILKDIIKKAPKIVEDTLADGGLSDAVAKRAKAASSQKTLPEEIVSDKKKVQKVLKSSPKQSKVKE